MDRSFDLQPVACDSLLSDRHPSPTVSPTIDPALLHGKILLKTHSYSAWGGAVTAQMYLPIELQQVWRQLIDYPRWTQYFPDITCSEVVQVVKSGVKSDSLKRLHQAASKAFLFFTAQVEIYLRVLETQHQRIQFSLESGSFSEFSADLQLQECGKGTLLIYSVRATPTLPVPGMLIEQAIQMDLPSNLLQMRRVMCETCGV